MLLQIYCNNLVSNHVVIMLIRFVSRFIVHLCNAIYFLTIFNTSYRRFTNFLNFRILDLNTTLVYQILFLRGVSRPSERTRYQFVQAYQQKFSYKNTAGVAYDLVGLVFSQRSFFILFSTRTQLICTYYVWMQKGSKQKEVARTPIGGPFKLSPCQPSNLLATFLHTGFHYQATSTIENRQRQLTEDEGVQEVELHARGGQRT